MTVNRGSDWRKWDLHVHSINTHMNNHFENKTKEYFQKIEKSDVSVFAITDYFTVDDQYETIKKFKSLYPKSEKVFFINVEFRLDTNVSSEPGGHVNVHIIFDNKIPEIKVKEFISSLELTETNPNGTHKVISDLKSIKDFESATITLEVLKQKLKERFGNDDSFFIVFPSTGHGAIRPALDKDTSGQYHALRNGPLSDELDKHADFLFGDKQSTDYYLDTSRYDHAKKKPVIKGSDAHQIETIGIDNNGIGDKFTWIKSETTFEGLRQILFEPEDRVDLNELVPDRKSDYLVIDYVQFQQEFTSSDEEKKEQTSKIYFNPNLNTIIGGRSTGKSTLINSIANKIGYSLSEKEDWQVENMHTFSNSNFKVYWKDGQEHYNDNKITFIPQDYMIKLAEQKNVEERNSLIYSAIKSDEKNNSLIQSYEEDKEKINTEVTDFIKQWSTRKKQKQDLKRPEGNEEEIKGEINKIESSLSKYNEASTVFGENEQNKLTQFNDQLRSLENNIKKYNSNLDNIKNINDLSISFSNAETPDKNYNNSIQEAITELSKDLNIKWHTKIENIKIEQEQAKNKCQNSFDDIKNSKEYISLTELVSKNKDLLNLTKQLENQKSSLNEFKKFEKTNIQLDQEIKELENKILRKYSEYSTIKEKLKDSFQVESTKNNIKITISFLNKNFEDAVPYLRKNNKNNIDFISNFESNKTETINNIFNVHNLSFIQGKNMEDLIKDIFSNEWSQTSYDVIYDNDNFNQMSQGKKAFVILTLLLDFSQDKKPVIIDQPEDSLDNRSIYQELTKYLKEKKKDRQIILVTHNPNVVVGSDAENIIVANQNSTKEPNLNGVQFSYFNGGLENTFTTKNKKEALKRKGIREHVIEILEGGKEAFINREHKYTSKK